MPATDAELMDELREADRNLAWLAKHYFQVQGKAEGQYVVIHKQKLVAVGQTLDGATEIAVKAGVPIDECLIDYIPWKGESWLL